MDVPRTVVRNKKKPKCLWRVTDKISVFDINRLRWSGLKHLRDITSDSDFVGLNLTSHLCAQSVTLSMSDCKILPISAGSPTVIDKLVSSAKRLIFAYHQLCLLYKLKTVKVLEWILEEYRHHLCVMSHILY